MSRRPPRADPERLNPPTAVPSAALTAALCLLLSAAVWAVFGQTLGHGFVNMDDDAYVVSNEMVRRGLTWEGVRWAFAFGNIGHWHPLTWLSHMADTTVFGIGPAGPHAVNVLLHTASSVLLFLTLQRMTGSTWRSLFAAALFAIHPLRAESVAWIAERKDVLGTFFFILTLLAYAGYVKRPSPLRYAWVATALALGLLSKNMLVTAPFVLLLLDYWPLRRLTPPSMSRALVSLVLEKLPLVALSAASVAMTLSVPEGVASYNRFDLPTRIANALAAYVVYIRQTLWPVDLVASYPVVPIPLWKEGLWLAILLAITGMAIARRRERPYFIVGWLWYAGMAVPIAGLVQISFYAQADRYTYLPQIGLCLALTWGAAEWCASHVRARATAIAAVLVLAALATLAWRQTATWRSSESLWQHALDHSRDNAVAEYSLADALERTGRTQEAIAGYRRALAIRPDTPIALNELGQILVSQGRDEEAVPLLRRAIELQPDYAIAQNNFGILLARRHQPAEAIEHLRIAARLRPGTAEIENNLGRALVLVGRGEEALPHFRNAIAINPGYAEAHANLGRALGAMGRYDEAIVELMAAVKVVPEDPFVRYDLATALVKRNRLDEAILHLREAARLTGNAQPEILDTLAITLSMTGQTTDASRLARLALDLAIDQGNTALVRAIESRRRGP